MPPTLRPFQQDLERDCYAAWDAGAVNIMPVAATGSGKTVVLSKMLYDEPGASIAIAHRKELVSQIALALARNGVRHRVVGAKKGSPLVRIITALQVAELGYSFLDPNAKTGVGGVDTVVTMQEPWFAQVRLAVQDEGHHVLKNNKWGRAARLFPNARGLFPTATPCRADGRGLGRHADGLTDAMVLAPTMRDIINMGYLTDYTVLCPPNDLDLSDVEVSPTTGDFNAIQTRKAVHRSKKIVGNVVEHYVSRANGKLGITFAVDVVSAIEIASEFRKAGVHAEVVSAKTPDDLRAAIIRRFRRRELLQLVNVDLFGEGFDLPAIEVVSMARPTDSFSLYSQHFGRALRLMVTDEQNRNWHRYSDAERLRFIAQSMKPKAIIMDHVNNYHRHLGPPDKYRTWTLDRRERRAKRDSDAIPIRTCIQCLQPYERIYKCCPYCNTYQPPAARSSPKLVDGDLTELDPEYLAAMRGDIARIDGSPRIPQSISEIAQMAVRKRHIERQQSQSVLRNSISWWAGLSAALGHSESESYRRFYFRFGIDVQNAQLLGAREAEELAAKVKIELSKYQIDDTVNAEGYFTT